MGKLVDRVASLESQLGVVGNEKKAALEKVSQMEKQIKVLTARHVVDLCLASRAAKKSYSAVLGSLKEKWENIRLDVNCEIVLQKFAANIDLQAKEIELGAE